MNGPEMLAMRLAADLRPVRRLRPPAHRAAAWLGLAIVLGGAIATLSDLGPVFVRLAAVPDERWAMTGALATAVLAAVAAFQLSLPDRPGIWAAIPIPPAILWLSASGMGCLRAGWPGLEPPSMDESGRCLLFIVGLSIPLSALLLVMLHRAHPLRPGLVATLGGLASAATAAVLLTLFHPYDAAWTDFAAHVLAVMLVVLANRAIGRRASAWDAPPAA